MSRFSIVVLLCLCSSFKIAKGQTTAKPTCTEIGAFEIIDGTCKNYYICLDDGEGLNPVILSCASSAIFDPSLGRCVSENTTTCLQTTTMAPTTTSAPLCLRYGRFPIQDVECKKYYLCYWNGVRYTIMGNLTCPNTLVFYPLSEKCVSPQTYNCPEKIEPLFVTGTDQSQVPRMFHRADGSTRLMLNRSLFLLNANSAARSTFEAFWKFWSF